MQMSRNAATEYIWSRVPELAVARYKELEPQILAIWAKQSSWNRRAAELAQLLPASRPLPAGIPSMPSPLLGTLVGGLAGAGLGYGAGWLGEQLLPSHWRRGRLRNTLAMIGGGIGAMPGAGMMALNVAGGKPFNDMSMFERTGYDVDEAAKITHDFDKLKSPWVKDSSAGTLSGLGFDPDEFNEAIWSDPRVNSNLSQPVQAAASGLVTGAANLPGKSTGLVTPLDIARVAAGMGSGYVSGLAVGKTLGLLMGMPDKTQDRLKDTGMWAGLISQVVPIAFGGR